MLVITCLLPSRALLAAANIQVNFAAIPSRIRVTCNTAATVVLKQVPVRRMKRISDFCIDRPAIGRYGPIEARKKGLRN